MAGDERLLAAITSRASPPRERGRPARIRLGTVEPTLQRQARRPLQGSGRGWEVACSDNVTGETHPGARASRPHPYSCSEPQIHRTALQRATKPPFTESLPFCQAHLLHQGRSAITPGHCFGREHAVDAGGVGGCYIAGELSGTLRQRMRAGRPRSRVGSLFPLVLLLERTHVSMGIENCRVWAPNGAD